MKSTVYRIKDLENTFDLINDGKDHKGKKYQLKSIDRAPGSGIAGDSIAHQQGMYHVDGDDNFIVVGSAKEHPGYFYLIKNQEAYNGNDGKDYWDIDLVMTHPGGIQVAEDILVIGNEQYNGLTTRSDRSNIRFFDIDDEDNVTELKHLLIERRGEGKIASAVGLTKRTTKNSDDEVIEQWILTVRSKKSMTFYSLLGDPKDSNNTFEMFDTFKLDVYDMKDYQCVQLFLDEDNELWLFGMPNGSSKKDELWLYKFSVSTDDDNNAITAITNADCKLSKHYYRDGTGPRFMYASCVYFKSSSENTDGSYNGEFKLFSADGHVGTDKKIACNVWKK